MRIFPYKIPDTPIDPLTIEEQVRASGFQVPHFWLVLARHRPKAAAMLAKFVACTGLLALMTRMGLFHKEGRKVLGYIFVSLLCLAFMGTMITMIFMLR